VNVLIYDCETTGLDKEKDRIIQHGGVIFNFYTKKILNVFSCLVYDPSFPEITKEIERITGWNQADLIRFGVLPIVAIDRLTSFYNEYNIEAVVAHNGRGYDREMLDMEIKRSTFERTNSSQRICFTDNFDFSQVVDLPWLDTMVDIQYPVTKKKDLLTIAAAHEFLNPFPHNATFDCVTVAKILMKYSLKEIVEGAYNNVGRKRFVVKCHCHYDEKDRFKALGYKWKELDNKVYENSWVRKIYADEFGLELEATKPANLEVLEEIQPDERILALYESLFTLKAYDSDGRELALEGGNAI